MQTAPTPTQRSLALRDAVARLRVDGPCPDCPVPDDAPTPCEPGAPVCPLQDVD